jgi:Flp pilus assembly protein TadD
VEVASSTAATALPEILLELADVQAWRGDYDDALELYQRARAVLGLDARAWRGEAMVRRRQGDYAGALAVVDAALTALPEDHPGIAEIRLEQGWTLCVCGRRQDAIDALRQGLLHAGDDAVAARLLAMLADTLLDEGLDGEALEAARTACARFERAGDDIGLISALRVLGAAHRAFERLDEAAAVLQRAVALAGRTGTIEELAGCLLNLGMVELCRGDLTAAIECDRQAIAEFERLDHGSGQAAGFGNLAEKLLLVGAAGEALSWADRALAKAAAIGHVPTLADAGRTRALALDALGRRGEALAAARAAAEAFRLLGDDDAERACRDLLESAPTS